MAPKKKVSALIKLQIQAGKANPAPPLGPALGSHGVNIMDFCKQYNAATQDKMGQVIPVEITVFEDRSFTFILKTPPAAALLKKAAGVTSGSKRPNTEKVGKVFGPVMVLWFLALAAIGGWNIVKAPEVLKAFNPWWAAQFFIEWALTKFGWFTNYSSSGVISAPPMDVFGIAIDSPVKKYLLTLSVVAIMTLAAKNMVRSGMGRAWMAVRDMDVAAEVIGIPILKTKLLAFAISSFYCGVAGALWAFVLLGTVDPQAFDLHRSFQVLFMIIVGGVGSILGSYLGAAFIVLLPIVLNVVGQLFHGAVSTQFLSNMEMMLFGGLIIFFLIVEPHGLARLWQIAKEKLRMWPFPH